MIQTCDSAVVYSFIYFWKWSVVDNLNYNISEFWCIKSTIDLKKSETMFVIQDQKQQQASTDFDSLL